ncbi:unnamed protein product [Coregonus sp. 'balchen']|nr:unnamed protein product [Coregonus sp. 'balchen']
MLLDSQGPMSMPHSHGPPMGGMVGHPSVSSTSRPLPSPMSTLGSPMNGLASPYSVITKRPLFKHNPPGVSQSLNYTPPLAVQEERQRGREPGENEVESTSSFNEEMPVDKILDAELATNDPVTNICQAADKQLFTLVEWAKRIPHFSELPLDDQVILLRAGWNELLIASFSHRSVTVKDGILLATGLHVQRSSAHSAGVGSIFDRVLTELVFAKLLLRLPALRSIGLKCLEHLFFFKLIGDTPIDTFLMEMLEAPHQIT